MNQANNSNHNSLINLMNNNSENQKKLEGALYDDSMFGSIEGGGECDMEVTRHTPRHNIGNDKIGTPAIEYRLRSASKRRMFGMELSGNHEEGVEEKIKKIHIDDTLDDGMDNSLGWSPVKVKRNKVDGSQLSCFNLSSSLLGVKSNATSSFSKLLASADDGGRNEFSQSQPMMNLSKEEFKSISKCSDLDLKQADDNHVLNPNDTYLSPQCKYEGASIGSYFAKHSEQLSAVGKLGISGDSSKLKRNIYDTDVADSDGHGHEEVEKRYGHEKQNKDRETMMECSFMSVLDDISASDNTLEICKKVINKKSKTNTFSTTQSEHVPTTDSKSSHSSLASRMSFAPSLNSTAISPSYKDEDFRTSHYENVSSGIGTATTSGSYNARHNLNSRTNSLKYSSSETASVMQMSLSEILSILPSQISLTLPCYSTYKLNYLRANNLSGRSLTLILKYLSDIETLNAINLNVSQKQFVIPSSFNGLLTEEVLITPVKSGFYKFNIGVYLMDQTFLPFSPIIIECCIRSEEIILEKKWPFLSNFNRIRFDLFENEEECNDKYLEFMIGNEYFSNEIGLNCVLNDANHMYFNSHHGSSESSITRYQFKLVNNLFVSTKTQSAFRIPFSILSNADTKASARLSISTDSQNFSKLIVSSAIEAHVWKKTLLTQPCLQSSESCLHLSHSKHQQLNLRNKSKTSAINVVLGVLGNGKSWTSNVTFSETNFIIAPLGKHRVAVRLARKCEPTANQAYITASHHGGIKDNTFSMRIAFKVINDA